MAVQLVKICDGWFEGGQNKVPDSFCFTTALNLDNKTGQNVVVRIERPASKTQVSADQTTLAEV